MTITHQTPLSSLDSKLTPNSHPRVRRFLLPQFHAILPSRTARRPRCSPLPGNTQMRIYVIACPRIPSEARSTSGRGPVRPARLCPPTPRPSEHHPRRRQRMMNQDRVRNFQKSALGRVRLLRMSGGRRRLSLLHCRPATACSERRSSPPLLLNDSSPSAVEAGRQYVNRT